MALNNETIPAQADAVVPVTDEGETFMVNYTWWLGLQVLLPLAIAIMMWTPIASKIRGVNWSFEKNFASGDLSLFASLLFFGVLAETSQIKSKKLKITFYQMVSVIAGCCSLIIFSISKYITIDLDLPKTLQESFPNEAASLSNLNFSIGAFAVLLVASFTFDIKRKFNS